MNSAQILDFIQNPAKLNKAEAQDLVAMLEEFPYCGSLHALYLKALKNDNNYLYTKQLKRTAIAVPDRKVLYHWVEKPIEIISDAATEPIKPKIDFKAVPIVAEKPVPIVIEIPAEAPKSAPEATDALPKPEPIQPPTVATKPVKEEDLDLLHLPASVRETVLKARRIREMYGQKQTEEKVPSTVEKTSVATPEASALQPIIDEIAPQASAVQPVIEKTTPTPVTAKEEPKHEPVPETAELAAPERIEHVAPEPVEFSVSELEPAFEEVVEIEPIAKTITEEPKPETPTVQPNILLTAPVKPVVEEKTEPTDTTSEKHSFLDWLKTGVGKPISTEDLDDLFEPDPDETEEAITESIADVEVILPTEEPAEEPEETLPSTAMAEKLAESFIQKKNLKKPERLQTFEAGGLNTGEQASYITETLAQIYVGQKLYDRAINAYEILRLKYPEKSSFFAARISDIKELINN